MERQIKSRTKVRGGGTDYKQKITELVERIENTEFLKFLYQLLLSFKEKWGI